VRRSGFFGAGAGKGKKKEEAKKKEEDDDEEEEEQRKIQVANLTETRNPKPETRSSEP